MGSSYDAAVHDDSTRGSAISAAMPAYPTRRLFGLDFVDFRAIEPITAALFESRDVRPERWRCVLTPNVDHVVRYLKHPEEAETAAHASMVLPDGMPIVWASRLLGRRLTARLAGSDLFPDLWRRCCAAATPIVVIASSDEVASRMRAANPNSRCIVPPVFAESDRATIDAIVEQAVAASEEIDARFLAVGVSMPKHHRIANGIRRRWAGQYAGTPTVLLVGASPDFALGLARRAPRWMQRSGLEWLHRLLSDPRRMARRYLVDDPKFLGIVWREYRAGRRA